MKISNLNVVDVLVAEFRETIMHAIPQMNICLRSRDESDVHGAVEKAFPKVSEHGRISSFLT